MNQKVHDYVSFRYSFKILVNDKDKILICLRNERHQFISNAYEVPNMNANIFWFNFYKRPIILMSQIKVSQSDIIMKN